MVDFGTMCARQEYTLDGMKVDCRVPRGSFSPDLGPFVLRVQDVWWSVKVKWSGEPIPGSIESTDLGFSSTKIWCGPQPQASLKIFSLWGHKNISRWFSMHLCTMDRLLSRIETMYQLWIEIYRSWCQGLLAPTSLLDKGDRNITFLPIQWFSHKFYLETSPPSW